RIIDVGETLVRPSRGLVDLGRALHIQSLMRALAIENLHEVIKLCLLLQEVTPGGLGGFFLQSEMHALVATILLRVAGPDAFNADAQAEPPDRQFAQMKQRVCRSERDSIIAADVGRQAALLKKPFKYGKSVIFAGGGKRFAAQQVTTGMIGDGQRIAVQAGAQQKLAFVIGAPKFVRPLA